MKFTSLPRITTNRRHLLPVFAMTILILSLTFAWQTGYAQQQAQLSLADILIGLRSKKATLDARNKLLSEAVKVRGITFALMPEIEKELETTGASKELIEAVRAKSPVIKSSPTPAPIPVSTPTPAPPPYTAYQQSADAHLVKGEYDLAVADYNKVIELNPKNAVTYLSRGLSYYYKQSYNEAISDYNKGIELAPNESMAYFNRGDSYEKLGEAQKAIADYQKAVALNPANDEAKKALKTLQDEQAKAAQAKAEQPKTFSQPRPQEVTSPAPSKEQPKTPPQPIDVGRLNLSQAIKMVTPAYSAEARKFRIEGQVTVEVNLDEEGNVVSAKAKSGPGLLRGFSEDAARKSKFNPVLKEGAAVKAIGFIVYDFKIN